MKKKIIFIIFCFLILFVGSFRVEAVTDYSLKYEITEFNLSNEKLTIGGKAFINNSSKSAKILVYLYDSNYNKYQIGYETSDGSFNVSFELNKIKADVEYKLGIEVKNIDEILKHVEPIEVNFLSNSMSYWNFDGSSLVCNPNFSGSPCSESEEDDSVCSIEPAEYSDCSSKKFENDCDSMKIRTTSDDGTVVSAYVSIDESGDFRMKNDYSSVTVTAGRSFAFSLQYIYNLSWKFKRLNCNGVYETKCKETLRDELEKNYFEHAKVDSLENRLKGSVSADYEFKNDENFENAGSWSCSSNSALYSALDAGHLTISCDYEIKNAYINYYTNYVTYSDKSADNNYKSLGPYFYLPLDYKENFFTWNIRTGNLSLIKLRKVLNNYDLAFPSSWRINTDKCRVKVNKNFLSSDNSLVYRSVDTNISNENDRKLYYLIEGSNWYNYFYDSSGKLNDSNFNRIRVTFNNLDYATITLTNEKVKELLSSYDSKGYTNWENIDSSGKSNLVNECYFEEINRTHCKWGEFSSSCD